MRKETREKERTRFQESVNLCQDRTHKWEQLGDPIATDIFCRGFRLKFDTMPPLSLKPAPCMVTSKRQVERIMPMLPNWLEKGIVREIVTPQPLFFSRLFTVPKPEKGIYRPIIDSGWTPWPRLSRTCAKGCGAHR